MQMSRKRLIHVLEGSVQSIHIFHEDALSLGEKRSSTKLKNTSPKQKICSITF